MPRHHILVKCQTTGLRNDPHSLSPVGLKPPIQFTIATTKICVHVTGGECRLENPFQKGI